MSTVIGATPLCVRIGLSYCTQEVFFIQGEVNIAPKVAMPQSFAP